jgi:hypothetical protein
VSTPNLSAARLYEFSRLSDTRDSRFSIKNRPITQHEAHQAGESAQSAAVAATNHALKLGLHEELYYCLSSTIHSILLAAARRPIAVKQFGSLGHRQSDKFRLRIASAARRAASRCEVLEGL